jgi:hypothetical protein
MSYRTYLRPKGTGDYRLCGKQDGGEGMCASGSARLARHGESYTALSLVLGESRSLSWGIMPIPPMSPLLAPVQTVQGRRGSTAIVRGETIQPVKPGKRTNGPPKTRYHVQQQRTTGDPKGASPEGVGVLIVAKGVPPARSSEGEQVIMTTGKRGGTRDA